MWTPEEFWTFFFEHSPSEQARLLPILFNPEPLARLNEAAEQKRPKRGGGNGDDKDRELFKRVMKEKEEEGGKEEGKWAAFGAKAGKR